MMLTLRRLSDTGRATFGILSDAENKQLAVTLELPWKLNAHNVSCVPAGTYDVHRRWSPKHKCEVFELAGVPDRGNIELHVGNVPADSLGCILLGTSFGEGSIRDSRRAFDRFMALMKDVNGFTLTILPADDHQPDLAA
jgi:hypothetical protein